MSPRHHWICLIEKFCTNIQDYLLHVLNVAKQEFLNKKIFDEKILLFHLPELVIKSTFANVTVVDVYCVR